MDKKLIYIHTLLIALTTYFISQADAWAAEPKAAFNTLLSFNGGQECLNWQNKRATLLHQNVTLAVEKFEQVICVDGQINDGDDKKLIDVVSEYPSSQHFALVIRSPGGETKSALNIAETLVTKNSYVFVVDYCASSCANYILAAGKKRYILKDALLLFHGGVTLDHLTQAAEQVKSFYASANLPDYEKNVEEIRADLTNQISRQEALLDQLGISRHLFRWMNLFPNMSENDRLKRCPANSGMVLYAPEVLERFNYILDSYEGPEDQLRLDNLVTQYGGKSQLCFWGTLE